MVDKMSIKTAAFTVFSFLILFHFPFIFKIYVGFTKTGFMTQIWLAAILFQVKSHYFRRNFLIH